MAETDPAATGEQDSTTTYHISTSLRDYEHEEQTGTIIDTGFESHLTFTTESRAAEAAHAYYLNYEHIYDNIDFEPHQCIDISVFKQTDDNSTVFVGKVMG